jgi:hypothetical protein
MPEGEQKRRANISIRAIFADILLHYDQKQ